MELIQNTNVFFENIAHSYMDKGGNLLIGVTTLMKKHGLSVDYGNIRESVMDKAAENGKAIHNIIDCYCKGQQDFEIGYSALQQGALKAFKKLELKVAASEYLVSDNEIVASSIDLVLEDYSLVDVKSTSILHLVPLAWQLSIYAYLFELQNPGLKVPALYGIHIKNNKAEKIEIKRIESEVIKELIKCEKKGEIFSNLPTTITENAEMVELYDLESLIISIQNEAALAIKNREKLISKIYSEMEKNNVKKIDNDLMTITRILPNKRIKIDSKKLLSEYPTIYNNMIKETNIKGTVRITLK